LKDAFALSRGKSAPWPDLKWIVADDDRKQPGPPASKGEEILALSNSSPDDVAFLQFTSGSTSDPKGVMITYGNLAHNLTLITSELSASTDTVVVSWLPQYHDMGLIGMYEVLGVEPKQRLESLEFSRHTLLLAWQDRTWACCTAVGPGTT
jgi:acyl-CoA synthetase (AMP-forming)/AMP-acid ligase II